MPSRALPGEPSRTAVDVAAIRALHRRARFVQRQRVALDNAFLAFVRVEVLGVNSHSPEPDRKRAAKVSAAIRKQLSAGQAPDGVSPGLRSELVALWLATTGAVKPLERIEAGYRKEMAKLAAGLPGAAFVAGLKGFALPGFSLLLGETGELGNYPNPAKVWKRMGLAVIHGEAQGQRCDAVLAALHGYCPDRRSVSWMVFDSLFRHQRPGDRYRDTYDTAKAAYLERGWTKLHAHRAAKRKAEKLFLRDLWAAWRSEAAGAADPLGTDQQPADAQMSRVGPGPLAADQKFCDALGRSVGGDPLASDQGPGDIHGSDVAREPLAEAA